MSASLIALLALALLGSFALTGLGEEDGDDDDKSSPPLPDETEGTEGVDTLFSATGNDVLTGYGGNDEIFSVNGDDTLYGGAGNDYLVTWDAMGQTGEDVQYGGAGNDVLWGENSDVLTGGEGQDVFLIGAVPENEVGIEEGFIFSQAGISFLTPESINPSRITDFDPETETLGLVNGETTTFPTGFVRFEAIEGENAVRAGIENVGATSEEDDVTWLVTLENVTLEDMEAAKEDGRVLGYD